MKLIREFEERIREEYQQGKLPGFIHMYRNQEAIAVAACMHLGNDDYIASTHRGHGHCIAKGCDIEDMLLELACKQDGLCKGKGGSMHIADMSKGMLGANAIVGGGPPIAAGAALTARTLGNGMVSMAFIGDGASDQGTVAESLNLAFVLQLPMIFMYENNHYAEFTRNPKPDGRIAIFLPCTRLSAKPCSAAGTAVVRRRSRPCHPVTTDILKVTHNNTAMQMN
jgi:pyruvate dehydrogenase E1 component alpha subunit